MKSVNVPGTISSLDHNGCLAEIGVVIASMSRETLQALVDAFQSLQIKKKASSGIIVPDLMPGHGWTSIAFNTPRDLYSLTLRGVFWEVNHEVLDTFIHQGAIPFLARGTVNELLKTIDLGAVNE